MSDRNDDQGRAGVPQPGAPQSGSYGAPMPGSYGAPRPQQQPGPYGAPVPHPGTPYGAAPRPRREADPTRPITPSVSGAAARSALLAVAAVAAVLFVSSVLRFAGTSTFQGPLESDANGYTSLWEFFNDWVFSPFPFYAGAFLTLAFLTPVLRRSPLPVVLLRAVLAGAGGTVAIMVVGVFTGFTKAIRQSDWTWVLTDIITDPIADGVEDTVILVAAATVVWLWLGRPGARTRRFASPGMPGTVPPADAMPPATVPQQPAGQYGAPRPGQTHQAQPQAPQYGAPQWGAPQQPPVPQQPTQQPFRPGGPQQSAPQAPAPQWAPPPTQGDDTAGR